MRVCIDFDGVLHNPYDRVHGYKMGRPIVGALDGVKELVRRGHTVVIHTARVLSPEDRAHVEKWLAYFGFEHYIDSIAITKPLADIYVDDKGYRFTEWSALEILTIERKGKQ